jgi:hypothetical protein
MTQDNLTLEFKPNPIQSNETQPTVEAWNAFELAELSLQLRIPFPSFFPIWDYPKIEFLLLTVLGIEHTFMHMF